MDWIFDNFFIVIVIVAGIFGFLKDKVEKQKQQERKSQNRPRPAATPSGSSRPEQQERVRTTRLEQQQTATMKTVEEQQKEQMKQLANRYKANTQTQFKHEQSSHKAFIRDKARDPKQDRTHAEKQFKKQMKHNLSRKGLVNSIVMAEVMGPPRAKKPYKSIMDERRS